ncbi:MAG TPA: hypothetical protein VJA16_21920 [Thermoanaerobaculia bacterium]
MPDRPTSLRLSPEVFELLERLVTIRGLSKTEIVVLGILVQAEAFNLIPSVAATLAKLLPPPRTDADTRRRQRLSQQRTRARRRGDAIPKLKPGGPRRRPASS